MIVSNLPWIVMSLFMASLAHAQEPLLHPEMVTVRHPGNPADPATGHGAVAYEYRLGKYEVTLAEYTVFLNAVAASDPYSLYNPAMAADLNIAGIARSGESGSYTYSVLGSPQHPIAYVSFFDAARFCNWLQNGATPGADTEDGAYPVNGATNGAVVKNAEAKWWIPTEDEWYKAAYYQPAEEGGDVDHYWLFPTRSNQLPNNQPGEVVNQANYKTAVLSVTQSDSCLPAINYLTDVGSYRSSATFYGTFDQAGNVWEWIDVEIESFRGLRGAGWINVEKYLPSTFRHGAHPPAAEIPEVGLRIAALPK